VNSHEAKQILIAWRPGHGDLRDPRVAEALEHARRDPALHAWLEKHAAFQRTVEKSFQQIPVPTDLRDRILSGRKLVKVGFWTWRREWLRAAAVFLLLLGLAGFWFRPRPTHSFSTFRERTVLGVQRVYPAMDIVTNDMAQVRKFLAGRNAPADYKLPAGLSRLPVIGGGVLSWQGRGVSMVCLDSIDAGTLFLFVLNESSVNDPPPGAPEFVPVFEMMTASWTEDGKVFVLAGSGGMEALHRHL
jgi:uncharacterized membrane protein YbaN (DUF454 family)